VDPYLAAVHATLEAMRNVACVGAEPIALTDCLNYGSPQDPQVMAAFIAGVEGIAAAARGIGRRGDATAAVPIVSGNVSFYNHSAAGRAIAPSPIVACAGRLRDWAHAVSLRVKTPGSRLLLLGARRPELAGSELLDHLATRNAGAAGPLVPVDFATERAALYAVLDLIERGWVSAAHDISSGGFAVTVAEMLLGISGPLRIGADCRVSAVAPELATAPLLFGEAPGYVLEVPAGWGAEALAFLAAERVPAWDVGVTTIAPRLRIERDGHVLMDVELARLAAVHRGALAEVLA
jgi:phosphoribosylformylglycinamidine synthase